MRRRVSIGGAEARGTSGVVSTPGDPVRPWLARVSIALVLGLLAVLTFRQVGSPDVGFHLKAGEHILAGHGWPRFDPFTYTASDHLYIDTSWGYQVLAALANDVTGAPGLEILHAVLLLATFGVVLATARLGPADPVTLPALLLLGGLASEMRFETRPEILSYLLLAVVLHILHRRAEGRPSPLWALVPIHLLWANLHGLFVLGWGAIACFAAGLALRDRRIDRPLALWGTASVLATLVNPYGWRGALFPFLLATRLDPGNVFAQSIGEFTSPFALRLSEQYPFYPRIPIFAFRAFAVLSLLALIPVLRRRRFWCAALWLAFMALTYRMIRNIPLLVVACLPATAWGISLTAAVGRKHLKNRLTGLLLHAVPAATGVAAVLLGILVYHDTYYLASRRTERFGFGWNRQVLPIDAAAFAVRSGLKGRVLNHLNLGGWLMWALPDPIFIDGRLEVMGEEFYDEYRRALTSPEALEATVSRYGVGWVIFPYAFNPDLLGRLSRDARWDLVYADHLAAIFVRRGASGSNVVRSLPSPIVAPALLRSLPGLGGPTRPGRCRRWLDGLRRRAVFPVEDHSLGLFHLYRGELDQAAARFSRGIVASGGAWYEFYNNLGAVLFRMKRYDDARACYEIVLAEDPESRMARERLLSLGR